MKKIRNVVAALVLALIPLVSFALPALAISSPDTIGFGDGGPYANYKVFYNVQSTGDMLFLAEGYVYYASTPTDYTASQAFLFSVTNSTGGVLISTTLKEYGDRPVGIYLSANQVATYGISINGSFGIRISGNPLVFASSIGNNVTAMLAPTQYINQATATASLNPLKTFCINVAQNMQIVDGVTTYVVPVQGQQYLTTTGGNLFLEGIPGLDTLCPTLFQAASAVLQAEQPSGIGAGTVNMTILNSFGKTTNNAVQSIGVYLGVGASNGGAVVLLIGGIAVSVWIFKATGSPFAVVASIMLLPFVGALMGFINLAAVLTGSFIVVLVALFYFFTRGIL